MNYSNYNKRKSHTPNTPNRKNIEIEFGPDDQYLSPEIKDNIPESFSRRQNPQRNRSRHRNGHVRRKKLSNFSIIVIAATFVIVTVLFALFWEDSQPETLYEAVPEPEAVEDSLLNFPPDGRSPEQDLLNELYWVDQEFLYINRFSRPGYLIDEINGIVIHFIGNPNTTAQQNRNFFNNLAFTEERHASSNFIVCLDGRIVQCVPVDEVAYASHHRNYDSLSIEMCHPDETGAFTDETLAATIRLTAWLSVQFDLSADDIIRHYDIVRRDGSQKRCPRYFVDNEEAWASFKDAVTIAMAEFR